MKSKPPLLVEVPVFVRVRRPSTFSVLSKSTAPVTSKVLPTVLEAVARKPPVKVERITLKQLLRDMAQMG